MRYLIIVAVYILLILLHVDFAIPEQGEVTSNVYFCQEVDCATLLITVLEHYPEAQCAFYDIGETRIRDFLMSNQRTIFLHADAVDKELRPFVQPIERPGLMHHKFCVYENTVLTGSWNPTERGTYLNDNYVLFLTHPTVAKAYKDELSRITGFKRTSPVHLRNETRDVEVLFCPVHNCEQQVMGLVEEAATSIRVLSFTFTSKPLQTSLLEAHARGVHIEFLQEKRQAHLSEIEEVLATAGAQVRYDGNPYTMHGKMWLLDNATLILGSYNPTKAGTTTNDENIVLLTGHDHLVDAFNAEFERIWEQGIIKPIA